MRKRDLQLKYEHAQDTIRDLVVENGKLRDKVNELLERLERQDRKLKMASLAERIKQW